MTSRRIPARPRFLAAGIEAARRGPRRVVTAAAVGLFAALAVGVAPVVAADGTVTIKDNVFQPAAVTVGVNETVTWSNLGARNHTVTADDGSFDSGPLQPGDAFATVFPTAGSFPYHCSIHPTMHGTITVGAGAPARSPSGAPEVTPPPGTLPPSVGPVPTQVQPPTVGSPIASAGAAGSDPRAAAGASAADPGPASSTAPTVGLPALIGLIALVLAAVVALSFVIPRRRRS